MRALDNANYNRITKIICNDEMDGESSTPSSQQSTPQGRTNGGVMAPAEEMLRSMSINSHSSSISDDSNSEASSTGHQSSLLQERVSEGPFIFTKVF